MEVFFLFLSQQHEFSLLSLLNSGTFELNERQSLVLGNDTARLLVLAFWQHVAGHTGRVVVVVVTSDHARVAGCGQGRLRHRGRPSHFGSGYVRGQAQLLGH